MVSQDKVLEILNEPEFKPGGMAYKHLTSNKSDHLVAVRSAVDRMRELHDIEDREFNDVCFEVMKAMQQKIGGF